MIMPKGRQTIRRSGPNLTDPMTPVDGRENRRIRLWDFDAKPGSTIARLESVYLGAIDSVDKVAEHKAAAIRSGKFTPDGANDDALQFALNNLVPTFKRGRAAISAAKKEVTALRDKIKLQPIDKTDVVGFLRRQEIRSWLKSMPEEARGKYLASNVDSLDPTIALAVMESTPEEGIAPASVRTVILDRALEAQHGAAVAELQELERAIEAAESAVETGRDEVRRETGMLDPHRFDQLAAPVEAKHGAPWLRKSIENGNEVVRVIVPGTNHSPQIATPEQIETGVYYRDFDEFNKRNAA